MSQVVFVFCFGVALLIIVIVGSTEHGPQALLLEVNSWRYPSVPALMPGEVANSRSSAPILSRSNTLICLCEVWVDLPLLWRATHTQAGDPAIALVFMSFALFVSPVLGQFFSSSPILVPFRSSPFEFTILVHVFFFQSWPAAASQMPGF